MNQRIAVALLLVGGLLSVSGSSDDMPIATRHVAAQDKVSATATADLRDGEKVVFLGGTFIERAQRYGWLEAELQAQYPQRRLQFRNLGWSGDTAGAESRGIFDPPAQGYARMLQQLRDIKPSVIVINYGGNESFQGEAGLPQFSAQYQRLLDDLSGLKAQLVLMTPHFHLEMPAPLPTARGRNINLKRYRDAIAEIAAQRKLPMIDLQKLDWSGVKPSDISDNGVHFNDKGQRLLAAQFSRLWFGTDSERIVSVPTSGAVTTNAGTVIDLARTEKSVSFTYKANQLSVSGQSRLQVSGLAPGSYQVAVNGQVTGVVSAADLAAGKPGLLVGPAEVAKVETLKRKVIEKDTMYFHRWRPQNVTYLFLFRKHEQGNNAKEVEEFEAIVSKMDDELLSLKQPTEMTVSVQLKTD